MTEARKALITEVLLSADQSHRICYAAGVGNQKFLVMRCLQFMLAGKSGDDLISCLREEQEIQVGVFELSQVSYGDAKSIYGLVTQAQLREYKRIVTGLEMVLGKWEKDESVVTGF